ncbi:MAG: PIN domain-containing protein [Verrucomicrobia bacterium]|nr:PIN domain-containing protein [Verrucomicrobiota bacterium]
MVAVDTNLLVYAHRREMRAHAAALEAIRGLVEGNSAWAIPWPCAHEFISVVTNPKPFKRPTSPRDAIRFLRSLESEHLHWLGEGIGYLDQLDRLLAGGAAVGGRIHDARVAALCLYHGVRELWSADRDFSVFPQLKTHNPVVSAH